LYNIPTASNLATADFLLSSPFMSATYERAVDDFADFNQRRKLMIEIDEAEVRRKIELDHETD